MPIALDHLILSVNDVGESVRFYTRVLGFSDDGPDGPFSVLRVSPELTILLAPGQTRGGQHLAFAMPAAEFEAAFDRIKDSAVPYGDRFGGVGNMKGPGPESGARGEGLAVYVLDPSQHLIEIRTYPAPTAD